MGQSNNPRGAARHRAPATNHSPARQRTRRVAHTITDAVHGNGILRTARAKATYKVATGARRAAQEERTLRENKQPVQQRKLGQQQHSLPSTQLQIHPLQAPQNFHPQPAAQQHHTTPALPPLHQPRPPRGEKPQPSNRTKHIKPTQYTNEPAIVTELATNRPPKPAPQPRNGPEAHTTQKPSQGA
jgi:hypothetical protein